MQPVKPTLASEILRISHPWVLSVSFLLYALGAGIARYLGSSIRWDVYWAGQAAVVLLLLSSYFLREFYSLPIVSAFERSVPMPVLSRNQLLIVMATTLTAGAVLTVLMFASGALNSPAFIFVGLAFLLALAYAMPPLSLAASGYGELVFAILICNLVPGLAFLLQAGVFHRLLPLMTFPLTFLYLAAALALQLEGYARDVLRERRTMLVRLGWQPGMNLHNLLILLGFFALGSAALVGLPWQLTWPGLLGLIVGAFEIVQMLTIANGAKPRWGLLRITAAATFALTVYFLTFALWIG
jgi:1,4-dihydroxy-2-naphthoate octaprenyltransferase